MVYVYPCPNDLKEGERIEIYEIHLNRSFYATVHSSDYGTLYVTLDHQPGMVYSVDPLVSKWRRANDYRTEEMVFVEYGAMCTEKNCPDPFKPFAENKPGFVCWSCAHR